MKKTILFIYSIVGLAIVLQAQNDNVTITGGYVPKLRPVEKIAIKPVVQDTFTKTSVPSYTLLDPIVPYTYTPDTLSAARMKTEPIKRLKRFYLKAGFGMYLSPNLEVRMNSLRSKSIQYDLHYAYNAAYAKRLYTRKTKPLYGYAGYQDHGGGGNFSYLMKKHTLGISAKYSSQQRHYYGYDASLPGQDTLTKKDIRQNYQKVDFGVSFKNNLLWDSTKLVTNNYVRYYYMFDKYKAGEHGLEIKTDWHKQVAGFFVGGAIGVDYYNFKAMSAAKGKGGGLVHIQPYIKAGRKIWEVLAGINMAVGFDTATKFYIAPNIQARLNAYKEHVIIYADITGGAYRNTYDNLRLQNPFINGNIKTGNSYKPIDLQAGIKGKFASNFYYNIGGGYSKIFNKAFFITDTTRTVHNTFTVIYDDLGTGKIYGEIGYQKGETFRLGLKINANFFDTGNLTKAWYMPKYEATLSGMYNIRDKFIFKADLFYLGDLWAPEYRYNAGMNKWVEHPIVLRNAIDINIGVEYRFNKLLSFYLNGTNLAAFRYHRWLNYPTQGIGVNGGITLSF